MKKTYRKNMLLALSLVLVMSAGPVLAGGSVAPVGTYLYANPENRECFKGQLTVTFDTPGKRLVLAYGRKYRKDRKSRANTVETEREKFKPYLAKVIDEGRKAIFWHLPIDKYDLVVIDVEKMCLYEGLGLLRGSDPALATPEYLAEIQESLDVRKDRIGGWEAFFDTKKFERFETDGVRGCVLVQQMRLGKALAESGAVLKGCIHSIDICWLERAKVEGVGWQVVTRQQLYRNELPARTFFQHAYRNDLKGIRIGGRKPKEIGISLSR